MPPTWLMPSFVPGDEQKPTWASRMEQVTTPT
eukprot:CAMPEP_0202893930 /NCGR_PEP_ID=MMETSP1392-20130828/3413_1 /ASSEMBLY_ACC=CAM_ASM_000868 /TAXON_ID=225041 /ORGANISM="Chlamydomonas chlamydogama, Strain SAG 11-48b" /LENGTH=31 /DNA_ID= /DNA_START= /DNA_END= /DNA_ORIENTATION=